MSDIPDEIYVIEPVLTMMDIEFSFDRQPTAFAIDFVDREMLVELPASRNALMTIEEEHIPVDEQVVINLGGGLLCIVDVEVDEEEEDEGPRAKVLSVGATRDEKSLFIELSIKFKRVQFKPGVCTAK